jgi:toluene monooxygenase system protein E
VGVTRRTYWHLAKLGTRPSDYDIATSRLLYYPGRGFETNVPLAAWYRDYQDGSALRCSDWDQFRDPRETTYAKYTELQRAKEAFVDGVLAAGGRPPSPAWKDTLARVLPPLRFPVHALQMLAAYAGHMAPGGRIVIACAFQAADEVRRIQRLAYRMRELDLADTGREQWERDASWQPLRELVERLLVTRDWGELLIALQLAVKPRFDALFGGYLGELAREAGDDALANILFSLDEDARWHASWSHELVRVAVADRPANADVIAGYLERWRAPAQRAIAAFADVLGPRATAIAEAE